MSVVVGVLCASVVLLCGAPRRRGTLTRPQRGAGVWGRPGLGARADNRRGFGFDGTQHDARLHVVVTQAATLLRSGMPPDNVWESLGGVRTNALGIPDADDLAALVDPSEARPSWDPRKWWRSRRRVGRTDSMQLVERQAHAIVVACRLAAQVGAPLAVVLDSIVLTLVASAEAEADRDAALAGPQSTAQVLLWLPGVGAGLGTVLGADPIGLLLGGGPLALVPAAGIILMLVGRRWSARMVGQARDAGSPP